MMTFSREHELLQRGDIDGLMALKRAQFGGFEMMARGYNSSADTPVYTTDGRDLNEIWAEFQATLAIKNESRQRLVDLLTYPVTDRIEDVVQYGEDGDGFEKASEYGVPQSARPAASFLSLGYTFEWYDVASRFTWLYLAEATAAEIEARHQNILEKDNANVFNEVMKTVFRKENRTSVMTGLNYNVYSFWNGDGNKPNPYKTNTFDGTYTHYRTSGANTINPGDLDEISTAFKNLGYSRLTGTQQFALVNTAELDVIRTFRVDTGAKYDFIPAVAEPSFILAADETVAGQRPPVTYRGLPVAGSYGELLLIEENFIPAGYVTAFVSGGESNIANPIGFREHANPAFRGLRLVKGREPDYPLVDSYYQRGFGTGVRQRGAGFVMKITTSATYTAPPAFAD